MKQSVIDWLVDKLFDPPTLLQEQKEWIDKAKEMEKEQVCDFADYVINRANDFEAGDIDHREYEGSIDEMFERRYREGGTKLSPEEERFWKEVDELRKEREYNKNTNEK
jgi:hypothetical protein